MAESPLFRNMRAWVQEEIARRQRDIGAVGNSINAGNVVGNSDANARVGVRENSAGTTFLRRRLNLIEGNGIGVTLADDSTDEEVDTTVGLVALTSNWDVGGFAIQNVDHLKFDVLTAGNEPAYAEGNLYYSEEDKALTYHTDQSDVQVNIGQESVTRAKNDQGAAITNGQAVYVSGATGGNPDVKLARGDLIATARATIGLVTQASIADQAVGYITTLGIVRGIDTSAFTVGDTLYLSPTTAGALTATQPSYPNFPLRIGVVTRSHASDGKIFVNPYLEREVYSQGSVLFADSIGRIAEDNTNFLWDNTNKHLSLGAIRALNVNGLRLADDAGNLGVFVADGGNVGVHTTDIEAWGRAAIELGSGNAIMYQDSGGADIHYLHNLYWDGTDFRYKITGPASLMFEVNGQIGFQTAPSGTADNVATLSDAMRIANDGNVGFAGEISPSHNVHVEKDGSTTTVRVSDGTSSVFMQAHTSQGVRFLLDDNQASGKRFDLESGQTVGHFTITNFDDSLKVLDIDKDGYNQPAALGEAWNAPTFNTGWGNVGAPYYNAGYRLFGDMVMLRGAVERSSGSLQTVFTLPTAYRPSSEVVVAGPVSDITIQTDGDVRVQSVISNGTDVFLDGIWFSI